MTARCRSLLLSLLTLTLALALGACGDGGAAAEEQSIVVLRVNFDATAVELHQIRVGAHLANPAMDNTLLFPAARTPEPIPSGATLALLLPITLSGMLDLNVSGLNAMGNPVAAGSGQAIIVVGTRVYYTIELRTCAASGC